MVDVEYASMTAPGVPPRTVNLDEATIRRAYRAADGNLAAAARLLGVHRATFYRYLKKLNISRDDLESGVGLRMGDVGLKWERGSIVSQACVFATVQAADTAFAARRIFFLVFWEAL
ncbi:MAG: helix-turn-helix domain-containing protein [Syntrophotaleaceae bacterium]